MSNITVVGFDYTTIDPALADEARATAKRIRDRTHAVTCDIGRDLIAIKEKMPHGTFGEWIAAEFQMSDRTAQNYMNAARFLEGKSEKFSLLPPSAVYALAGAPGEIVAEVEAEVERGVVPKVADIRGRIAGVTKAQQALADAKSLEQAKKERENEKRRRAAEKTRIERIKAEQEAVELRRNEQAEKVAVFLVSNLRGAGVVKLLGLLEDADWYRVERQFHHAGHFRLLLPAEAIDAKFTSEASA